MSDVVAFDKARVDMGLSEGNAVVTRTEGNYGTNRASEFCTSYTAASGAILKGGGRQMVQFTVRKSIYGMRLGLIRADWDVKGGNSSPFPHALLSRSGIHRGVGFARGSCVAPRYSQAGGK
jgi:hypothetical protein